jgi:hypothetical protein
VLVIVGTTGIIGYVGVLNERPIEERKEGTILLYHGIMAQQGTDHGLGEEIRWGIIPGKWFCSTFQKELFFRQEEDDLFLEKT